MTVTVLGGGLAGSEAAWALAERGVAVTLVEMRPVVRTAAHQTDRLAELVCSNTFKSVELVNAHGLLKAELRLLGSMLLECADAARVPGGTALAVDREVFAAAVQERISGHPNITVVREEAAALPETGIVATGPLTSERLAGAIAARLGSAALAFYDAIAPIVSAESLDRDAALRPLPLREGRGDDYLNAPMSRDGVRGVHRRAPRRRPVHRPRVRPGALLRGVHAGRGNGAPRAGDAPLRPDEAGGAAPTRAPAASRTPWCSCAGRTGPGRCGTWSASRPGFAFRSSSGCSA